MRRWIAVLGVASLLAACGAPSVQEAVRRTPESGASESFARPAADVYAAAREVVMAAAETHDWKELRIVHDDPEGGVLVAERRLEGVVPGLATRDLWSFYVRADGPERATVTFVDESSDQLAVSTGLRSWKKGQGTIFPAMAEVLGGPSARSRESERTVQGAAPPAEHPQAPPSSDIPATIDPESRSASAGEPGGSTVASTAAAPRTPPPAAAVPSLTTEHLLALLQASDEWRASTRRRRLGGGDVVTVGEWAQIEVRGGRAAVAFPSYPAPPAYDVARLIRFLDVAGVPVDVLPGGAFRMP